MMKILVTLGVMSVILNSCAVMQKTAKKNLYDGFYSKKSHSEKSRVYVDIVDENIRIHPTRQNNNREIDTTKACEVFFSELNAETKNDFTLSQNSFDVDFLTIPFKLRFEEKDVPTQLNTNLNGAVYLGFRRDVYKIEYNTTPLKSALRNTIHFGYSIGLFMGFGNTFMSPTNTNNMLQQEYDGIVLSKGVAGIVGINNFTVGLTLGFDNLLDRNKSIWIYEGKPWLGLAFGLNLN